MADDSGSGEWQRCGTHASLRCSPCSDRLMAWSVTPRSLLSSAAELGGAADVVYFREFLPECVLAVTSELVGRDDQISNALGNYELAICQRSDDPWGPDLMQSASALHA